MTRLRNGVAAAVAIGALLIAAPSSSLIGMYFRAPIAAYVTQYVDQQDNARVGSKQAIALPIQESHQADPSGRAPAVQTRGTSDGSGEQTAAWDAMQTTTMVSHATEILEKDPRRTVGLENELAELPLSKEGRELRLLDAGATAPQSQEPSREKVSALVQDLAAARQELTTNVVQYRKTLAEERDRSAALASELATAQRAVETQMVQSNKTANEAAQFKKAADTAVSELQRERERAEAVAREFAKVRREIETQAAQSQKAVDEAVQQKQTAEAAIQAMTASAEQRRRALDEAQARAAALASELAGTRREIETQAAQSQTIVDEAVQQRPTAESVIADSQYPQQERDRTEAMVRNVASVPRTIEGSVADGRSAGYVVHVTQAVKRAVTEPPKAAETQGNAEAAKLIARASALLGQGNVGAARIVLERAAESGNAQASFMLAETYDPVILSAWGTFGTRGETTKARELYSKAQAGGIHEANDRINALRQ